MAKNNTSIQPPKGFRDFLPAEATKRRFVADKIISVFERFGFDPLETPALEYASLLEGKYGEEEKLIFKFEDRGGRELAMRYDQTVPLARVVAQYEDKLPIPFKRYQIQPVWRAEKPQKGRYREFTQCDFDITGTSSPVADAESIAVVYEVLKVLGFKNFLILFNDRRTLSETILKSGIKKELELDVIRTLDKLEKIGEEKATQDLEKIGVAKTKIENLMMCLGRRPKLPGQIKPEIDLKFIDNITTNLKYFNVPSKNVLYTPTLARGLDYYTGLIMEAVIEDYKGGSVGGGGRYDNLIGMFADKPIPSVGLAFGFDRIIEAMEQFDLLPKTKTNTKVLVTVFNEDIKEKSFEIARDLKNQNIPTEVYLEPEAKLEKQLKYANKKCIPFAIIIGPDELENQTFTLKNLITREQEIIPLSQLLEKLKNIV